ncbi:MAG: GNAT family N-acetyltransferase [Alphaproteobacteria bacterium]
MTENIFNEFPIINLADIRLREIVSNDTKSFYNYICNPKVSRYLSDDDTPSSLIEAEEELMYWANLYKYRRSIYWGITKANSGHLIGTCGFNNWNRTHKRVEISYDLSANYWGKGIMTKAVKTICDFAFTRMHAIRIQATVATDNYGSIKVLEKSLFKRDGTMRNYGILKGETKDFYMYSLVKEDIIF